MSIVKKALCGTLVLAFGAMAFSVQAQNASQQPSTKPRAVLFKVHDIKPVENTDGVITHCDFLVTFYNRTTESLRQAKLDMGWTDEVTERYVIDENEVKTASSASRMQNRNARASSMGDITTSIDMPALGAFKQATVKGSVKTEKCFLLLDNLDYNVASCSIIGKDTEQQQGTRRGRVATSRNNSECANLFEYVDSKNPEYYDEFKNISFSEQERLLSDEKKQDTSDINAAYDNIMKNLEKTNSVLINIK